MFMFEIRDTYIIYIYIYSMCVCICARDKSVKHMAHNVQT